jgi:hypothetical protein
MPRRDLAKHLFRASSLDIIEIHHETDVSKWTSYQICGMRYVRMNGELNAIPVMAICEIDFGEDEQALAREIAYGLIGKELPSDGAAKDHDDQQELVSMARDAISAVRRLRRQAIEVEDTYTERVARGCQASLDMVVERIYEHQAKNAEQTE